MCIENTSHQLCFIYGGLVMYDEFAKWLDRILDENMPLPGVAINFNIYEEVDLHWSIQLISSTYFDEEDETGIVTRSSRQGKICTNGSRV